MQLVVSLPRFPAKWAIRILTGSYWIYCILIVVAYRASLTAILANPAPRLTIDTLHELSTSPISCGVSGEHNRQLFITSTDDEVSHKIASKIETIRTATDAVSFEQFLLSFIIDIVFVYFRERRSAEYHKENLPILKTNIS